MLFNSFVFVAFLPLALAGYFLAARVGRRPAGLWLILASAVFYGWWDARFVALLAGSIAFNYAAAELIAAVRRPRLQTALLGVAIAANLAVLAYFKYLYAVLQFLAVHGVAHVDFDSVVLPLGISFFSFTQIGYLIDVKQGVAEDRGLLDYVLFVTFFPHLIAGPILHNREMMPQFADPATYRVSARNLAVGLTIFIIGLLKKSLLADPNAADVAAGFAHPGDLPLAAAWRVAMAYSLQLYFDFSGYSDMAIGLARMFNVKFPLNFNSPYQAACIIDYWQRWHMTLTRYLTLYLYNPIALAVTRHRVARGRGIARRDQAKPGGFLVMVAFPTAVTMLLIGVWHGAGLQFVVFGLLHAACLLVNHAWRLAFRARPAGAGRWPGHAGGVLLTYGCVLVGAVFFRASSVSAALDMLGGMIGRHGVAAGGVTPRDLAWLAALYGIVWLLPNTQQIMHRYQPALGRAPAPPPAWLSWRPGPLWAVLCGCGAMLALLAMGGTSEFLYFQF
jgi:D-alanyl-lipoteichoic acid acyltransferase DltB (MBOAT superfamily)